MARRGPARQPADSPTCLACRAHLAINRGLCHTCYDRLSRQVRDGKTTWEKLERAGKARPRARRPWGLRGDPPKGK